MLTAHHSLLQDEKAKRALKDLSSSLGCGACIYLSLARSGKTNLCWHWILRVAASRALAPLCVNSGNALPVVA